MATSSSHQNDGIHHSLIPSFLHTYELTVCIDAVQVSVDIDMIGKAAVIPSFILMAKTSSHKNGHITVCQKMDN